MEILDCASQIESIRDSSGIIDTINSGILLDLISDRLERSFCLGLGKDWKTNMPDLDSTFGIDEILNEIWNDLARQLPFLDADILLKHPKVEVKWFLVTQTIL